MPLRGGQGEGAESEESADPREPGITESAGWMIGGRGAQMAVSFAANLVLVRLLTPADFGHFAIVAANVGIVASLTNFRLEDVLLRVPKSDLRAGTLSIFGSALALEVGLIFLGSTLLLLTMGYLDGPALLLVTGSSAASWVNAQKALYERDFEYREISIIQTSGRVLAQVLAVIGAALGFGAVVLYVRNLIQVAVMGLGLGVIGELRHLPARWLGSRDWRFLWERVRGFWADGLLERMFDRLVMAITGMLVSEQVTGLFYEARFLARAPQSLLAPLAFRIRMNQFSHHTGDEGRLDVVLRSLGVTAVPLLGATVLALWLADPVIPSLLGSGWEGTVSLFLAMLGLVPGLTLLDTIKAYFMSENRMKPFLWLGRSAQYAGAVLTSLVGLWTGAGTAHSLAWGLSAAYVLPVVFLVALLLHEARNRAAAAGLESPDEP